MIDETVEGRLAQALLDLGAYYADPLDGDVYVEWDLSSLLEFCRDWRSEIEELRYCE